MCLHIIFMFCIILITFLKNVLVRILQEFLSRLETLACKMCDHRTFQDDVKSFSKCTPVPSMLGLPWWLRRYRIYQNEGDLGLIPGWEDLWKREGLPTPVFLCGEFHRQRILVSYTLWGHKELDTITSCHVKSLLILVFYKTSYYQAYHLPMPVE